MATPHQTVFNVGRGIIMSPNGMYHLTSAPDYFNVHNNIVFDNRGTGIGESSGPMGTGTHNTYRNNLAYGNAGSNISVTSGSLSRTSGTISADPQFMNYNRDGGGDYRLKSNSSAIDHGMANYAPATDMDGTARPQVGSINVGSTYEHKRPAKK